MKVKVIIMSLRAHGLYSPWNPPRPEYWTGPPFPSPGDLPNPGIKPRSPTLQADSLPAEPPGKPSSPRVGSLSVLQGIFLTQESNRGLLHCRKIIYQLSYQGSLRGKWSIEINLPSLLTKRVFCYCCLFLRNVCVCILKLCMIFSGVLAISVVSVFKPFPSLLEK